MVFFLFFLFLKLFWWCHLALGVCLYEHTSGYNDNFKKRGTNKILVSLSLGPFLVTFPVLFTHGTVPKISMHVQYGEMHGWLQKSDCDHNHKMWEVQKSTQLAWTCLFCNSFACIMFLPIWCFFCRVTSSLLHFPLEDCQLTSHSGDGHRILI